MAVIFQNVKRQIIALSVMALLGISTLAQLTIGVPAVPEANPIKSLNESKNGSWLVKDLPLGETERQTKVAQELLQFDDYIYSEYSSGNAKFTIYLAYWKPGRAARGLAGGHTPDTCWTAAGCKILDRISEISPDPSLPPGEWRRFRMPGGTNAEVYFWHIVGGKVLHFDQESPIMWLRDAIREISVARSEQYFLRITTDGSFSDLVAMSSFRDVLKRVSQVVLPRTALNQ